MGPDGLVRECLRCGERKPLDRAHFYSDSGKRHGNGFQYVCLPCQGESSRERARKCLLCHEKKPGEGFPLGRKRTRRSAICWLCWEERAYAVDARIMAWRATWTDPKSARKVRRCCRCREVKDLEREFYLRRKGPSTVYSPHCKDCHNAVTGEAYARRRSDPEQVKRERAAGRATSKRYRETHREKARAASRAWKRRMYADPKRRAQLLEDHRITYRLKREREGLPVRPNGSRIKAVRQRERRRLPVEPLASLVTSVIEQREADANGERSAVVGTLCESLGISVRTLYRWKHEGTAVPVGVAERALLALEVEFESVWTPEGFPELYA